jgi:hypothetical protein
MARLFNFPSNDLRNQLLDKVFQRPTSRLLLHDIHHPFPDLSNLRCLSIRRFLNLVWSSFGEGNDKNSQEVAVSGLDVRMSLDERLPLADKGLEFVGGERHAAEVGEAIFALDFVDAEFDFAECMFFVVLEVCEGDFEDASLESIVGGF